MPKPRSGPRGRAIDESKHSDHPVHWADGFHKLNKRPKGYVAELTKEVHEHMNVFNASLKKSLERWLLKHGTAEPKNLIFHTELELNQSDTFQELGFLPPGHIPLSSPFQDQLETIDSNTTHEIIMDETAEVPRNPGNLNGELQVRETPLLPGGVPDFLEVEDEDSDNGRKSGEDIERELDQISKPTRRNRRKPARFYTQGPDLAKRREARKHTIQDLGLPDDEERSCLQRFTTSKFYGFLSTFLILTNSVFIGWQTNFLATRAMDDADKERPLQTGLPTEVLVIQASYCFLFAQDLVLRWIVDGFIWFVRSDESAWNILDIVVVCIGVVDLSTELLTVAQGGAKEDSFLSNFSVLKVLRVCRVVRVAKVIRTMKFFRELRMMVFSIMGCMKPLVWVFVVLGLMFYVFSIAFTAAAIDYMKTTQMWKDETNKNLIDAFGTLGRSILSLYMAMSGGDDWRNVFQALRNLPSFYSALFILFITFSIFAVVNIVTGIFVDSAMQANLVDKDIIVHEELERKKEYIEDLKHMFQALDTDQSGCITETELEKGLQNERIVAFFHLLKLGVSDAKMLFRLLDRNNDASLSIEEFIDGCNRLQGEASAVDTKMTYLEVTTMMTVLKEIKRDSEDLKRQMSASVASLQPRPTTVD